MTKSAFLGTILWNSQWGETISIPKYVIGIAATGETNLEQRQKSFGVKRSDWIETHGAQRREVTRRDGDGSEHGGDAGEGGEIVG